MWPWSAVWSIFTSLPQPLVAVPAFMFVEAFQAGAYTHPLFGSTEAHFVEYVGCIIFPQSMKTWGHGEV